MGRLGLDAAMTNTQILAELSRLSIFLRGKCSKERAVLTVLSEVTDPLCSNPPLSPQNQVDLLSTLHGEQNAAFECVGE